MKNILLLTTIYPLPNSDSQGTPVCHYFTREWVKMGYEVKVVHFQAVYPIVFYLMAKLFREKIASRTGAVVFTKRDKGDKQYTMDGVTVYRFPIFKRIPHGKFTKKVIKNQLLKIKQTFIDNNWIPDILIGHFSNPQLEIIHELKKTYNARTCMVMHGVGNDIKNVYKHKYQKIMNSIDVWGYRSMPIQKGFEKNFSKQKCSFLCYSGIPEKYILSENNRIFSCDMSKFVYVGDLIKRKHPLALIHAINEVYPHNNYHISYIGNGAEESNIKTLVNSLKINDCVSFIGHIARDEVFNILDESDCMIMISENEAFGLVYLEAMARGCITIGSRNEGIDGVIQYGVNGFLCESGNKTELANIIKQINSLPPDTKKQISQNAIATARELTDYNAAKKYITAITI